MTRLTKGKRVRSVMLAGIGAVLLSACANPNTEALVTAPATGDRYRDALADNYAMKARFEENQMRDMISANFYADKGLRALRGGEIAPEKPEDWGVWSDETLADLKGARQHLLYVIDQGAHKRLPIITARAMVSYDCWVEQKDEGFQPKHIADCRNDFLLNMAKIDSRMATQMPAPQMKTSAAATTAVLPPQDFLIYFNFDSAALNDDAMAVLRRAAANARQADTRVFEVVGHADRSGATAYNAALSRERAQAVQRAIVDMGFSKFNVIVRAEGETEPVVITGDGVKEPRNRRVRISVLDRRITS